MLTFLIIESMSIAPLLNWLAISSANDEFDSFDNELFLLSYLYLCLHYLGLYSYSNFPTDTWDAIPG